MCNWNFRFRRNLNNREVEDLHSLLQVLDFLSLLNRLPQTLVRSCNPSGFSCKAFFHSLVNDEEISNLEPFNLRWKSSVPHKIKVFTRLVFLGKFNTNDRVQRKNPQLTISPSQCVMCRGYYMLENTEGWEVLWKCTRITMYRTILIEKNSRIFKIRRWRRQISSRKQTS